jgi:ABC-type transport system involved in multi-copper enzyme maturation permease subunit
MTAHVARFFSFPLLAKELTEAAARRRTYVARVLYAVLLYALFATFMPRWLWQPGTSPLQAMGAGRQLFQQLIMLQAAGIALFLPALMCGRIAQEKERDSLVLLLLTELRPWQIVLQKYAGGLVPMLTFLLLGMPLAAIAYAFGGVTDATLFGQLAALVVTALQVGAIALFCSAWCRTTVSAFLATYFIGAAFYAGPPLLFLILKEVFYSAALVRGINWWQYDDYFFLHIPFAVVDLAGVSRSGGTFNALRLAKYAMPSLLSIPLFLTFARVALVRRAFAPPSHFFLKIFRRIDGWMKRSNHIVGNVMLIRERENLPGDQPIYWRETARRALGKVNYLVRMLVVVQIPVVFLCGFLGSVGYGGQCEELSVVAAFLVAMATIGLSVQAANTIVSERVHQTLEVLLTTPLSGHDIVRQKARALNRLAWVAAVPLLTVFGTELWIEAGMGPLSWGSSMLYRGDGWLAYAVCAVSLVAIYLPMIIWLSLWIGLRVRTRFRAIVTALVTLVLWVALPIVAVEAVESFRGSSTPAVNAIALLSPYTVGMLNEETHLRDFPFEDERVYSTSMLRQFPDNFPPLDPLALWWRMLSPWPLIVLNAVLYGTITLLIRRHALANADRWLRR